ncbi:hypothetical protein BGZ65_003458 [Modicella reniformis]|uniref:VPS9 domain-containing protein n=1 Tax=Modicella reniformis TaxID=1440133 RepID=A0A9P6SM52_9FUNG|nr:hypothetical protein BGZ65_003458 [Modicella reniformis]
MDPTRSMFLLASTPPPAIATTVTATAHTGLLASGHQKSVPTTSNHFLSLLFFHESTSWPTAALINDEQHKNLQVLKKTFETILAEIVQDRDRHQLVILCPVQQSLMGTDALSKREWEWDGIDEEFIITTAKGFKLLKQARLVSEQLFYDNDGRGWIVQFIDRPLVGMPQEESDRNIVPAESLVVNRHESSRLSSIFRMGRRSKRHIRKVGPAKRGTRRRPNNERPFLTLQIALQQFPGVSQRLEQLIMKFNDEAMAKNNMDDIRTMLDRLLTDSVELLNQVNSNSLAALLDEYETTVDDLDQLLESHIMNSTYDIVFFRITLQLKQQDWDLAEAILKLRNLDLGQVGSADTQQQYQCLVSALNEFQSLGVLRTPMEKLGCLVQTVRVASMLLGGADDLIPILLLTVLRSGISNLASNLHYMKNFVMFGDASRGECGYSLSTLEAVSRYILSHARQLSPLSARNQAYWENVCSGDLEGVKKIYTDTSWYVEVKTVVQQLPPPPFLRRQSEASLESNSDISVGLASPLQSRDAEGNNGVLLACKSQQIDVLRYLLEVQGNSINVSNYEGKTPLMLAVDIENVEMTKMILRVLSTNEKDGINKQDVLGNTAVHVCVAKGNLTILEELIKADSDLGLPNNNGDTPFINAAKLSDKSERYRRVASILAPKMKVEDLNRQNNAGDTAFHFIVDPTLIADLVSHGANPEVDNYSGWTPLLKWALDDNTAVVRGLLGTDRVDTLVTDTRGYTPLHMACLRSNLEMVEMLQARTPIDIQSTIDGSTPLQLACQSGLVLVVDFLLRKGANPQLRNWSNESPADMTKDATILELLDNAMLFWENRNDQSISRTAVASADTRRNVKRNTSLSATGKRAIRVVRGTMEQDGKVRYIVKSGSTSDPSTIVTMPRSLDDFQFLRENLLVEGPDACIPSLEGFYPPFLLSPSRPSKTVLAVSARRLDMFLNYLSNHPALANHELVWEFMLMPELQRDMIVERSQAKQLNAIDSIFDNFPRTVENLENEETYFRHFNDETLKLEAAIQQVRKYARKLSRSTQDVPQQLELFTAALEQSDAISLDSKGDYVQALRAAASTQMTMHPSDIESLGDLFEDFSFVIDGTLKALKHPQEVINSIRQLRASALKAEQAMRRNSMWWSGLSSIGEGTMTALSGAGVALGMVGYVATATLGAVSGTIVSRHIDISGKGKGSSRSRHTKAASESVVGKSPEPLLPRPLMAAAARSLTPPLQNKKPGSTLVVKLSPSSSQSSLGEIIGNGSTPIHHPQPRSRHSLDLSPRAISVLSSPFTSIAAAASAAASAATGQVPLKEIKDKIDKASSLLNSLRSSLFEELAHLQDHHTRELERAMRDFGARQLQIERSRLRDMMEILDDLQIGTNSTPAAAAVASGGGTGSGLGSQAFMGSTRNLTTALASHSAQTPGVGPSGNGTGFPFGSESDEKAEVRAQQRRELQRRNSNPRSIHFSEHDHHWRIDPTNQGIASNKGKDLMSEKVPFDDDD